MSRINTNVNSLLAQRVVGQNNGLLNGSLERLSTGLRINRGSDDPAGLIASENLRSEKAAISAAIGNAERADQVVNIAEGGLQEINTLLLEVQSLVGSSANDAGLSTEEREANQLQVDSILQTIDRIASATSFQGTKLLNGTFDFTVSAQATEVLDFQVNAAKLAFQEQRDVQILVTNSAQRAGMFLSLGGTELALSTQDSQFKFEVAGALGSREFTFAQSAATSSIADQVNTFTEVTGVSAVASGTGIVFKSVEFGSAEFVSIQIEEDAAQAGSLNQLVSNNTLAAATGAAAVSTTLGAAEGSNPVRDDGVDVGAIINGVQATSVGRVARINTDFLDVEIELSIGGTQNLGPIDAFTITGGGAKFNLGPNVDILNQVSVGIQNVAARNLGSLTTGFLDELGSSRSANLVDGNLEQAQKITNNSIGQISSLRGRLGAFQKNIVGATIRSLGVALENTSAAESAIRDTDFAEETAELTRSQILVQASQQALGIANSQPQSVLSLLG
ncbi:flagellin N-terminal helical domain-containing protein [Mucisphaera calidilacus]|uniref:Flagellin n=1 Tax=Mucisphaera calidilacus TaxID=2527982 RepID=A0A518BZN6_9BACT|nr:flagellin [Mucisphaera calidilacus]QDU72431.1 Flagellin A [Mucisphaera calidilacus]